MSVIEDQSTHISPEEVEEEITLNRNEPISSDNDQLSDPEEVSVPFTDSIQGFCYHTDSIYAVDSFGDLAATGSGDDLAYIWELSSGEPVATLKGHTDTVISVKFSRDGSLLATGGMDGLICIWSVPTANCIQSSSLGSDVEWLQFHPSEPILLAGVLEKSIWMISLPSGDVLHVFLGLTSTCTSGTFAGSRILGVDEEGTLIAWDATSGTRLFSIPSNDGRFKSDGWNVVVAKDDVAVLGGRNGNVRIVNVSQGTIIGGFDVQKESIEAIQFVNAIGVVVCASVDGTIVSYDIQRMKVRNTMKHDGPVVSIQVLGDGPMILSCSVDMTLREWDVRTGSETRKWTGHEGAILGFVITQDRKKIVTAGDDCLSLVFMLE